MFHVLKLGPVQLSQHTTNVYLRVTAGGDFSSPVFEQQDEAGIRALLEGVEPGQVRCEPALAEAADSLGLEVEEPPQKVLAARAAIAIYMAWEQRGVAGLGPDKALLFVEAATEFWLSKPWTHWDDSQPFQVTISGPLNRTYEGSIFGGEDGGEGLALYEQAGALKLLMDLQNRGQANAATSLPAIGVTLDNRPDYAVAALAAAGSVPRLPLPLKTGPAGILVPSTVEALILVASLRAIARLAPTRREALSTLVAGDAQMSVRVLAPQARVRN